jgi:integrase
MLAEKDFNLIDRLVSITGTLDKTNGYKKPRKGPPKTAKSNRKLSLTIRMIELVERTIGENQLAKLDNNKYLKGNYLFITKSGTPMQNNLFNLSLKTASERVGLNNKELAPHIFRRSHIPYYPKKEYQ